MLLLNWVCGIWLLDVLFVLVFVDDLFVLLLIGCVVVGVFLLSEVSIECVLWLDFVLFKLCLDYLLCVCGDLMCDDGIFDGDLIGVYVMLVVEYG